MSSRDREGKSSWTLAELSEASGVPGRTIRYYISRGLLDAPLQSGRDAAYGPQHLQRLEAIARLQAEGLTLQDIGIRLSRPARAVIAPPAPFFRYSLGAEVSVEVRAGLSPWRIKQIQAALNDFAARIAADGNSTPEEESTHE